MGGPAQPISVGAATAAGACVSLWRALLEMEVGLSFWKRERKVNCWKWSLGGGVKGL